MPEWLRRYVQPREGWLSLVFLLAMLFSLGWSVQRAHWIPQHDFVVPIAFWAAIVGALLGLTRLRVVFTLPLGALIGAGFVLWAVGGEYFTPLDQMGRLFALRGEAITWTRSVMVLASPAQLSPYAIGLAVLMWVTAFIAAYTIYRHHRVIDAILLVGITLVVNMSATYTELFYFIVLFSVAALLLWLRSALIGREESWRTRRVTQNLEVHGSMLRSGFGFVFFSVVLAWLLTTVAVASPLTGVWSSLDGAWNEIRNAFGPVMGPVSPDDPRFPGDGGFLSSFAVRGQWTSSDTEIMTVAATHPYYMRTYTYDRYTGHGWTWSDTARRNVAAGDRIFPGDTSERPYSETAFHLETVSVEIQHSVGRNIFTPGFPTQAFSPVVVRELDGTHLLAGLESAVGLETGRGYQISALISDATKAMLAGAGIAYPADIRATYMDSAGITDRTRELARSIVQEAGAADPYHQAEALANYLRTDPRFTYATHAALPDPDRDLVDFFLFDEEKGQTGYCEYFATAMAVMARSIGLPARVAVGYAPGERVEANVYQVRAADAHAWAEIYFPGYGWQTFEATKTIAPVTRLPGSGVVPPVRRVTDANGRQVSPFDESRTGDVFALPSLNPVPGGFRVGEQPPTEAARFNAAVVFGAVLGLLALFGLWRLFRLRRLFRVMAQGDRQWQSLAVAANRAGVNRPASETIYEYASWLEEELPSRRPEIRAIADGKVWQAYSGRSISSEAIARLERALARLRLPLLWLAIRRRLAAILSSRSRR